MDYSYKLPEVVKQVQCAVQEVVVEAGDGRAVDSSEDQTEKHVATPHSEI